MHLFQVGTAVSFTHGRYLCLPVIKIFGSPNLRIIVHSGTVDLAQTAPTSPRVFSANNHNHTARPWLTLELAVRMVFLPREEWLG